MTGRHGSPPVLEDPESAPEPGPTCPQCGGPSDRAGACRNCGTIFAPPVPAGPPELPADADPDTAQEGIRQLIRLMGEDPGREGLEETPERAVATLCGLTRGYELAACGRLGSIAAAEVISHYGARPETSLAKLAAQKPR